MNKIILLLTTLLISVSFQTFASTQNDVFANDRAKWLEIAENLKPELKYEKIRPLHIVKAQKDKNAFQGWKFNIVDKADKIYTKGFKTMWSVSLDFGNHYTGYFSFKTKIISKVMDSPIRLKFTFAELPAELNTPFDPYKPGLSRAWLQDEIITVTEQDKYITIPRRLSFRYVKIELLGVSGYFDFAIDDMYINAQTSAGDLKVSVPENSPQIIKDINKVASNTLKECMQTVFEDGPKRDQRLWLGDLYLQALANRYSYQNFDLVKRCLYLFAGTSTKDGLTMPCCFERPKPHTQDHFLLPYSLLFSSTLLEYLNDTNDYQTANDLWKVAKRQMENAFSYLDENGAYNMQDKRRPWLFFDWRKNLDVTVSIHCAIIFAINQTTELAKKIGKENEISHYKAIKEKIKTNIINNYFDKQNGVFVSGKNKQISQLSQAWAIIAEVMSGDEAKRAMKYVLTPNQNVVKVGTPYANHYIAEAMFKCGMNTEAKEYVVSYWGGMVKKGADTFWEAYDPNDDFISPYRFHPQNSACHAWSCTPVYFIHKYFK